MVTDSQPNRKKIQSMTSRTSAAKTNTPRLMRRAARPIASAAPIWPANLVEAKGVNKPCVVLWFKISKDQHGTQKQLVLPTARRLGTGGASDQCATGPTLGMELALRASGLSKGS